MLHYSFNYSIHVFPSKMLDDAVADTWVDCRYLRRQFEETSTPPTFLSAKLFVSNTTSFGLLTKCFDMPQPILRLNDKTGEDQKLEKNRLQTSSSGCLGWATLFYCGTP